MDQVVCPDLLMCPELLREKCSTQGEAVSEVITEKHLHYVVN